MLSGIPLCLLSRAANIFPCSALANLGAWVVGDGQVGVKLSSYVQRVEEVAVESSGL